MDPVKAKSIDAAADAFRATFVKGHRSPELDTLVRVIFPNDDDVATVAKIDLPNFKTGRILAVYVSRVWRIDGGQDDAALSKVVDSIDASMSNIKPLTAMEREPCTHAMPYSAESGDLCPTCCGCEDCCQIEEWEAANFDGGLTAREHARAIKARDAWNQARGLTP